MLAALLGAVMVSVLEELGIVHEVAQAYTLGIGIGWLSLGWAAKWKQ
jgi:hypothetical protein